MLQRAAAGSRPSHNQPWILNRAFRTTLNFEDGRQWPMTPGRRRLLTTAAAAVRVPIGRNRGHGPVPSPRLPFAGDGPGDAPARLSRPRFLSGGRRPVTALPMPVGFSLTPSRREIGGSVLSRQGSAGKAPDRSPHGDVPASARPNRGSGTRLAGVSQRGRAIEVWQQGPGQIPRKSEPGPWRAQTAEVPFGALGPNPRAKHPAQKRPGVRAGSTKLPISQ